MATDAQIKTAFQLAGFPYGRPTNPPPEGFIPTYPGSTLTLANLFDDAMLLQIEGRTSVGAGFVYDFAANLLEFVTTAGYGIDGRPLDLESVSIGEETYGFLDTTDYLVVVAHRLSNLRKTAELSGLVQTADISGLTTNAELTAAIAAHDTSNAAHAFIRDMITMLSGQIPSDAHIRSLISSTQSSLPALNRDGFNYTLQGRHTSDASDPLYFWTRPNFVPDTPGTQSSIGHVLTVVGRDDQEYAWRASTAGGQSAVDQIARDSAASAHTEIDTHVASPHNRDATARRDASAAKTDAANALSQAQSARNSVGTVSSNLLTLTQRFENHANNSSIHKTQLDVDTVITVGPTFIHNEKGPKNLSIAIRHPLNAYSDARIMTVSVAGQPAVTVGYDHTVLQQDTLAEVAAVSLDNIWSATDSIDDGQGGTRNIQRYAVGSYIPVVIRLLTGRGGTTEFIRVIDVLVEAPSAIQTVSVLANKAAYTALRTKDANTLYLWSE